MNEKWECYLCTDEFSFEERVSGFLGNFHPICKICSDKCISQKNVHKHRLSYHYKYGEITMCGEVPIERNRYNQN